MKANINGVELHYEIDGTGPICFVLHGGLGLDHTLYRRSLGPLANTLRLVFVDFRGNGRSERTPLDTITMEQLADDIAGLADQLHLDEFLVLGHSYGGFVAQELAVRHAERVAALLLIATRPGQYGVDEDVTRHKIPPRPAEQKALDEMPKIDTTSAQQFWHAATPHFTNAETIETVRSLLDQTQFEGPIYNHGDDVIYTSWSAIDRLPNLKMPVLVVAGNNDVIAAPGHARRIADHLQNGTLVEIDGANHFPWIETPEVFFDTVQHWLDENRLT